MFPSGRGGKTGALVARMDRELLLTDRSERGMERAVFAMRRISFAVCLLAWAAMCFAITPKVDNGSGCCAESQCASCATSGLPAMNGCCPATDSPSAPAPTTPCRAPEMSCQNVPVIAGVVPLHRHVFASGSVPVVSQKRVMSPGHQRLCVFLI